MLILMMEEIRRSPVDMVDISLFTGFLTSQLVQDFLHQGYDCTVELCNISLAVNTLFVHIIPCPKHELLIIEIGGSATLLCFEWHTFSRHSPVKSPRGRHISANLGEPNLSKSGYPHQRHLQTQN